MFVHINFAFGWTKISKQNKYTDLVFKGQHSYPIASLSKNVPVLSCGGLAKKYLVAGWHDRNGGFKEEVVICLPLT